MIFCELLIGAMPGHLWRKAFLCFWELNKAGVGFGKDDLNAIHFLISETSCKRALKCFFISDNRIVAFC